MDITKEVGQRIKKFRKERGLSQEKLAEELGVSRPVVTQIEQGKRSIKAGELVQLSKLLNISMDELLGDKEPEEVVLEEAEDKEESEEPNMRILVDRPKYEKFRQVLLYILNEVGSKANVGETVIYKLLYFIDFDFYEKYERQLIGATYQKNTHGPTPKEFVKIAEEMQEEDLIEQVESEYFSFPQTKYLPKEEPNLDKLDARELNMIDNVLDRLSDMNATQISEFSHKDVPWVTTEEGEDIEYEKVFYRTPEYSVREVDD